MLQQKIIDYEKFIFPFKTGLSWPIDVIINAIFDRYDLKIEYALILHILTFNQPWLCNMKTVINRPLDVTEQVFSFSRLCLIENWSLLQQWRVIFKLEWIKRVFLHRVFLTVFLAIPVLKQSRYFIQKKI